MRRSWAAGFQPYGCWLEGRRRYGVLRTSTTSESGAIGPFHGMVHDAQPYGLAQEWRGTNAVAALHLQLVPLYEDEIRSVEGASQADPVGIELPARAPSGMRS